MTRLAAGAEVIVIAAVVVLGAACACSDEGPRPVEPAAVSAPLDASRAPSAGPVARSRSSRTLATHRLVTGLAIDRGDVYFVAGGMSGESTIGRVPRAGGAIEIVATGGPWAGIAVTPRFVWSMVERGVVRAARGKPGTETLQISGEFSVGLAADGTGVWVAMKGRRGGLYRIDDEASAARRVVARSDLETVRAADGDVVAVVGGGGIRRLVGGRLVPLIPVDLGEIPAESQGRTLAVARGVVLVAANDLGLFPLDGGGWMTVRALPPTGPAVATALRYSGRHAVEGEAVFAVAGGAGRLAAALGATVTQAEPFVIVPLPGRAVVAMVLSDGEFYPVETGEHPVAALAVDARGIVWASCDPSDRTQVCTIRARDI